MDSFDECSLLRFLARHKRMPLARVSEKFNTCDRRTETVAAPLIAKRLITATPFSSYLGTLDIMYEVRGWRVFTMQDPNYIERAIGFITEHGLLTGSQLHAMLQLEPDDHPSEILAEALKDGRLIKDGKEWMLGAGPGIVERVEVITYLPTPEAVAAFPQVSALHGISLVERRNTTRTKVQIAIDLITSLPNRRATNSQMRKALGLSGETPPISYLRAGLKDGRLARAEYDWVLGEKERMAA